MTHFLWHGMSVGFAKVGIQKADTKACGDEERLALAWSPSRWSVIGARMGSEEGACNPFGLNLSPIAEVPAGNKAALRVFSESSSVGNGDRGDTFGWRHTLVGIPGNDAMQYDDSERV